MPTVAPYPLSELVVSAELLCVDVSRSVDGLFVVSGGVETGPEDVWM